MALPFSKLQTGKRDPDRFVGPTKTPFSVVWESNKSLSLEYCAVLKASISGKTRKLRRLNIATDGLVSESGGVIITP